MTAARMRALLEGAGIPPEKLQLGVPMSRLTSFRVGGPCDLLLDGATPEQAALALSICRQEGYPVFFLGNGTNLIVRDGGVEGMVLRLSSKAEPQVLREGADEVLLCAPAGQSLKSLSLFAARRGYAGLVPLSGVPGSLGGALVMNAGAYGTEMADLCPGAELLLASGEQRRVGAPELALSYRHSALMDNGALVLCVLLRLGRDDPEALLAAGAELSRRRREKQPLEFPSAGSTFKRPAGDFAARLIDGCGLRGLALGGAMVSQKHAGFVINRGGASARELLLLIEEVRRRVQEQTGVTLELEARVLGREA